MIERILGIDLGIASLGWSVIEYDNENDTNNRIVDCGVRLFTAAETPKEKESLNKARRDARGLRRVIKRRRGRMNEIKKLCIAHRLLSENGLNIEDGIFNSEANRTDVWMLRHDALHRPLERSELARVLIHIAKHRGYDFQTEEGDAGKVKSAGEELKKKFAEAGCKSVGEYLWIYPHISDERAIRRNKKDDYTISIHRDLLKAEIDEIFDAQTKLGNLLATGALKEEYKTIAFFVRPMQSIKEMVGYCTFLSNEKRAPKASPTAERFVALGKFFSTVIIDNQGIERKIIELKNVDELMQFAISKESLTYKQLRDFLELKNDFSIIFKGLSYKSKKSETTEWEKVIKETETKPWISLKGHATLKKALGDDVFNSFIADIDIVDNVATTLTYFKDEQQKKNELSKLSLDPQNIEILCKISFTDFNQLSIKAMKIINQIMIDGYQRYDEAVRYALDNNLLPIVKKEKDIFLPPLKETDIAILNPTVLRAFAQFRKVANALVKKYGSFDKVHFELAREVNTKGDIDNIKKGIAKNTKERAEANEWINENFTGTPTTRKNILKKRLFEQQGEVCPYTGERIKLELLFDEGYCEIDHILPRSRSADDSQANKVLCKSKANQDKTNRTPYEWFGHDNERWEHFEARMNTSNNLVKMGKGKISRLLKKNFDENSEKEFVSRNLNDTRYMSKAIKTYCENYWLLAHNDDKLRIQVRSGKLTSALRHQWGLDNKNRDTHTHHAADAIMIAFSTPSMVQKLSNYYKAKETQYEKEKPTLKSPMEHFREAVEAALTLERTETIITKDGTEIQLNRLIISRPPRASVTGQAHDDTYYSPTTRTVKKQNGKIDYLSDNEYRKAISTGSGLAKNGDMTRRDVFYTDKKINIVPLYIDDIARNKELSNIILSGIEIDLKQSTFYCSLHNDDLIKVHIKDKEYFGYFKFLETDGRINIEAIDGSEKFRFSINSANSLKKYTIDPLGYYHEVRGEKRLGTIPQEAQKRKFIKNS